MCAVMLQRTQFWALWLAAPRWAAVCAACRHRSQVCCCLTLHLVERSSSARDRIGRHKCSQGARAAGFKHQATKRESRTGRAGSGGLAGRQHARRQVTCVRQQWRERGRCRKRLHMSAVSAQMFTACCRNELQRNASASAVSAAMRCAQCTAHMCQQPRSTYPRQQAQPYLNTPSKHAVQYKCTKESSRKWRVPAECRGAPRVPRAPRAARARCPPRTRAAAAPRPAAPAPAEAALVTAQTLVLYRVAAPPQRSAA